MSQTYPLDAIVHRLERKPSLQSLKSEDHLVIFDARARKVVPKEPLLAMGRDLRYFLVSTRPGYVECRGPVCRIKSPATQASCEIEISYYVRCETGKEAQLVAFLNDGEHPLAVLDAFVSDCVERFASDPATARADVCLELLDLLPELKAYITRRACEETGLALLPTIRVPLAEKLQPVPLRTGYFPVRVCDYDRAIELKLATDLEVDAAHTMRAVIHHHRLSGAEQRVRKAVQKVMIEEIPLQRFCYELDDAVRMRLIEAINEMLLAEGRRITYLQLESPEIEKRPAELEEFAQSVECHIRDYDQKIRVEHRLQMTVGDLARFRRAGIGDLHLWAREKLDTITRSVLFDLTYLDLLLDGGRKEIKSWMERESLAVGYKVKQLLTLPALDPLEWKDALPLEPYEGTYVTKSSRVEVRLNIVVKGKITNLRDERLKPYLTPASKLADDMRALIRHETQALMHKVTPERFYMYFDFAHKEPPLRQEIEERLKGALVSKFAIDSDDIAVFAKPLETEITRRLAALQEKTHDLEVTCMSHRAGGLSEEVTYSILFSVQGVAFEGWYTFISRRFASPEEELEAIKTLLREDALTILQTMPSAWLQYTDIKIVEELRAILNASDRIKAGFGLVISIVNMRRHDTTGEGAQQKVLQEDIAINQRTQIAAAEASAEAKLEELATLEEKRKELEDMGMGREDPVLRDVTRRIGALTAELLAYPSRKDKQHVAALPGATDSEFDPNDYLRRYLPAPSEVKLLRDGSDGEEP
jgi:hypothetical protein